MRSAFGQRCEQAWRESQADAIRFSFAVLRAGPEAAESESRLYIVHDATLDGVKIGHSRNPRARFSNIRVANAHAVTLEVDVAGSQGIERIAHAFLAKERVNGEWFRCTPRTLTVCELLYALHDWEAGLAADGQEVDGEMAAGILADRAESFIDDLLELYEEEPAA